LKSNPNKHSLPGFLANSKHFTLFENQAQLGSF
jgi:hypothetical protein